MAKPERPRGRSELSTLERLLTTQLGDLKASGRTSQTVIETIFKTMRRNALSGDLPSLKEMFKLYDQLEAERARLVPKEKVQQGGVLVVPQGPHTIVPWESLYGPSRSSKLASTSSSRKPKRVNHGR